MTPSLPEHVEPSRSRLWLRRIAWCEPFWIAAVGVILLIPPRFLPAIVQPSVPSLRPLSALVLLFGLLIRRLAYHRLTQRTPIDWPLMILLLWLPVNWWASADGALSWEALSFLLLGVALYLALLNWPPAQQRPHLIAAIILFFGLCTALLAPWVSNLSIDKLFHVPGVEQLLHQLAAQVPGEINPNRIAGILVISLPLAFALLIQAGHLRLWRRGVYAVIALLLALGLILTQSRGAYLAAVIALGTIGIMRWPRWRYALPVVLIIGAIIVARMGIQPLLEMILAGGAINGVDGRLEIWSRALYAINDFPFTGIGIGTFDRVIPVLYPLFSIGPDVQLTHAHNLLLQIALDTGLPGFIAYVALIINTFVLIVQALRRRTSPLMWSLAAGVLGSLLALFIHGIFDAPLWGSKPAFLTWLLIALAMRVGLRAAADTAQPVELSSS